MTFQKGQSGNPSGRPKGIVDKRAKLREIIDNHGEELITKLVTLAKAGHFAALRLCIERLIPKAKPEEGISFDLPEGRIDAGENMLAIANGITQAVASGAMTIEEAQKFANFLKCQRWVISEAERKRDDDIANEERRKYWEQVEEKEEEDFSEDS